MRSQRDPTIFTVSFSSPGYCLSLLFHPVLLLYEAAAVFFEMKDCLAVFKESQNSKSHLYSSAVHSPFYIQYGGDDQKDLS